MINKTELRASLSIPVAETTSAAEAFQNQTLRPILKLQNEIYVMLFKKYALQKNPGFTALALEKKLDFIQQSFQNDSVLKNIFLGITLGMFTGSELEIYVNNSREFNRRINTMLTERIKSQVDCF
ncbi:hypothetical protein [Kaistella palustris]|uniref:hypothetical protein n=1 Tax=Kaistella palustris TaxID=493376 RepID=UPI000415BAC0|nr:hypothetical protein [Kaistella palustris]